MCRSVCPWASAGRSAPKWVHLVCGEWILFIFTGILFKFSHSTPSLPFQMVPGRLLRVRGSYVHQPRDHGEQMSAVFGESAGRDGRGIVAE